MATRVAGEAIPTGLARLPRLSRALLSARGAGWVAIVLLAGGGWLAFRGIDHRYISFSDGVYTYVAATIAKQGVHVLYGSVVLSQPPGIVLGAAAVWRASGSVEAIRLVLAALGLLTTLLTYKVARGNRLGPPVAAGAALIALTAPVHGQFSGLDGEAVLGPLALGLALALQRGRPTVAGALIGAGFFFKLTWLPFAVGGLVALALTGRRSDVRRGLAAAAVVVVGLYGAAIGASGWNAGSLFHEIVLGESGSGLQPGLFVAVAVLVAALWWPMLGLAPFGLGAVDRPTRILLAAGAVALAFTIKEGTFFNVLDPVEPFLAIAAAAGASRLRRRPGRRAAAILAVCLVGLCLHAVTVAGGPVASALPVPVGAALVRTDDQGLVDRAAGAIEASSTSRERVLVNPFLAVVAGRREVDDQADWFILAALARNCGGAGSACRLWARMKDVARRGGAAAVSVDSNVTGFDASFAHDTGVASMRRVFTAKRPPVTTAIYVHRRGTQSR